MPVEILKAIIVLLFLLAPVAALAGHPHNCSTALNVHNLLDLRYQEAVKAEGSVGQLRAKLFVSLKGTWTLVYEFTNGSACIMASGKDWQEVDWKPGRKS